MKDKKILKAYRFSKNTINNLEYLMKLNENNNATEEIENLINKAAKNYADTKLKAIINGDSLNIMDDILNLLNFGYISEEYVIYNLNISEDIKRKVFLKGKGEKNG